MIDNKFSLNEELVNFVIQERSVKARLHINNPADYNSHENLTAMKSILEKINKL